MDGEPVDFVTGFRDAESGKTFGRPVGVTVDPRGALIVADDLSNIVWRVSRIGAEPLPVPPVIPTEAGIQDEEVEDEAGVRPPTE